MTEWSTSVDPPLSPPPKYQSMTVTISPEFYERILRLQAKLQSQKRRRVSLSEIVRDAVTKEFDFHKIT